MTARYAIINSSELVKENRWDAGFHITKNELKDRLPELEARLTKDECWEILAKFSTSEKLPLMVLSRGSWSRPSEATMNAIAKEYPHLSIAVLEQHIAETKAKIEADLAETKAKLETATQVLTRSYPKHFRAGWIYPLLETDRFDDDFGTGFDHAAIPADYDPQTVSICDAWICNAKGEVHPGYNSNPVPISIEGIDVDKGRKLDAALPEPVSVVDWFKKR